METTLWRRPTDVIMERPSGDRAIPSSSVGPEVSCSGLPSGKRCRQIWKLSSPCKLRYIHFPSCDQAALVHGAFASPTCLPADPPPTGTTRQGNHSPLSISTSRTHLPSGER